METILMFFAIGAAGAITKDIIQDGSIQMPRKEGDQLVLGIIGGAFIGGIAAALVNHEPAMAFFAGYAGTSIIENLAEKNPTKMNRILLAKEDQEKEKEETIPEKIIRIAEKEGVDPQLALRVAQCESSFKPKARNVNKDGTIDRGLYQINNHWHAYVTDQQADDPEFAIKFFCKAVKEGNLSWWNSSKHCWGDT